MLTSIPGGWLAKRSGKQTMAFGVAVSSIITLLTPLIAEQSMELLILSRALMGLVMVSGGKGCEVSGLLGG